MTKIAYPCRLAVLLPALAAALLAACGAAPVSGDKPSAAAALAMLNRTSWGLNASTVRAMETLGWPSYLAGQLHPRGPALPASVQASIAAMSISQRPLDALLMEMQQRRKDADAGDDDAKKALRGGYDAANLLVPTSSAFYYAARPNIGVPRPSAELNSAIALDADWGLHPALRESLYPVYRAGQLAFVPFAGTPDLSRSHFETQDSIEMGRDGGAGKDYRSGFLSRLAGVLQGGAPIAFTDQLPLILRGGPQVPNLALRSLAKPSIDHRQGTIIAAMYKDTPLDAQVAGGFALRADLAREMAAEMDAASRAALSAKGFELEARRIARLMREKYAIGFVDVGGWDTHVGQGGATGYLAGRFDELGRGLAGFADEMGGQWRDAVVVVISEFGRTLRENGNRCTDHGHGTAYWVLGGGVHGGRIAGRQVDVTQATLFQNRDYPVLNDYRALFGGLFARIYGLGGAQLDTVFPGAAPADLGLV